MTSSGSTGMSRLTLVRPVHSQSEISRPVATEVKQKLIVTILNFLMKEKHFLTALGSFAGILVWLKQTTMLILLQTHFGGSS